MAICVLDAVQNKFNSEPGTVRTRTSRWLSLVADREKKKTTNNEDFEETEETEETETDQ